MVSDRKNYNTTLSADLLRQLKVYAAENDCRVNDLLEEAIRQFLATRKEPQPRK